MITQRQNRPRLLMYDHWEQNAIDLISPIIDICPLNGNPRFPLPGFAGLVSSLNIPVDSTVIDGLPDLRFVASCTTGLDHIDTAYATSKGVRVISLQGHTHLKDIWATAEHTWSLLLALARKLPFAHNDVIRGRWDRESWRGSELRGKTLGIIGLGRVGTQVATFASAFGMRTVSCGLHKAGFFFTSEDGTTKTVSAQADAVRSVLSVSDVVTVHVALTDQTRRMISSAQFEDMANGKIPYFVNTSRGAVVDEKALLNALLAGQVRGAALDVTECEPHIWSDLLDYAEKHDNLIVTPHLGGNTHESREKTQIIIANEILAFLR